MAEYTIDFGAPKTVHSLFLTGVNADANLAQSIGQSHIRVGNDRSEFSTSNEIVKDNIVSGGF